LQEKEMKVIHLFRLSKYKFSLLAPQESGFQLKEKRNKTKQNKTKQNKTKQNKTKQNKNQNNIVYCYYGEFSLTCPAAMQTYWNRRVFT